MGTAFGTRGAGGDGGRSGDPRGMGGDGPTRRGGEARGVYSDLDSQVFAYPTGEVVQFVTCCFLCEICEAADGELRADGHETTDVAFFETDRLPADLLEMHPTWLEDALSGEASLVR